MTVNAVSRCVRVPRNVDGKLYGTANLGACRVDVVGGVGSAPLFEENFEGAVSVDIVMTTALVVASNPYTGSKCARVNLKDGASDALLASKPAAISNQATVAYEGGALASANPPVRSVRFMIRFDDATWQGSTFTPPNTSSVNAKIAYYGLQNNRVDGFYIVAKGGTAGGINFGNNWTWTNDGRNVWYLETGQNWGAGTGWHEIVIQVDRVANPSWNVVTLYVDGVLATNPSYAVDGKMRVDKGWNIEHFSVSYTNDTDVSASVNRTETACGIQFDEIQIWAEALY